MENELVIRQEAVQFFNSKIARSKNYLPINDIHELKTRLYDFYSEENKSIFLDEILQQTNKYFSKDRQDAHGGKADPTCTKDQKFEKLLFYINQEIETLPKIAHQKFKDENQIRDKVFISYSHEDKSYLKDIHRHFKPFLDKINYWDDSKIEPGQKWKEEIEKALKETKVGILLVSTDFLGSDFIRDKEIPELLETAEKEGGVVLIVILKPCLFEEFDDLNKFQAMNPPSRPLSKMSDDEKEELLVNLVRQTKKILEKKDFECK